MSILPEKHDRRHRSQSLTRSTAVPTPGAGTVGPSPTVPSSLRSSRRCGWVLGLVCTLFWTALVTPAEVVQAQEPVRALSLEEAIERAMASNPAVLIPDAEEGSAEWGVRAARASLLPSASLGGGVSWQGSGEERFGSLTSGQLGVVSPPSWYFSQYSANLSFSLSGATLLAPAQARAGLEGARARTDAARAQLRLEVIQAYLAVLQGDEAVRLARAEIDRAEVNARLARAQVELGSATQLDLQQAELAVGRARVTLTREEGNARNARTSLLVLIGEEPGTEDGLELTTSFPLEAPEFDEESLVDRALSGNPELAQLRAQEREARVSVRSARSSYLPSLNAQAGWSGFTRQASDGSALVAQAEAQIEGQREQCQFQNEIFSRLADPLPTQNCGAISLGPDGRQAILDGNRAFPFDFTRQPPSVSLSISIPIFQGLQRQRQVEQARVALRSVELQEAERSRALRGSVSQALTAVRTALAAARIEEVNVEVARAQLRLAREQYEAGLVDFLQLSEAESVLARGEREFVGAVFAVHDAIAALEVIVGQPLIEY